MVHSTSRHGLTRWFLHSEGRPVQLHCPLFPPRTTGTTVRICSLEVMINYLPLRPSLWWARGLLQACFLSQGQWGCFLWGTRWRMKQNRQALQSRETLAKWHATNKQHWPRENPGNMLRSCKSDHILNKKRGRRENWVNSISQVSARGLWLILLHQMNQTRDTWYIHAVSKTGVVDQASNDLMSLMNSTLLNPG